MSSMTFMKSDLFSASILCSVSFNSVVCYCERGKSMLIVTKHYDLLYL